MQTSFTLSYDGWRQRIALILPYLENSDPLAARIAWGELARAPYATLDVARSRIDATAVEAGWSNPKLVSRHAAYTLLLGFAGSADDAARLEQRIEAAWTAHDTTNLAAMIGADLELRGPSRVGWVEAMYFADRTRTMPEIEAALLALNVHGDANRTVSRERVIQAYRTFIRERPPMAGFVAPQLADWNYWDATTEYIALLKSNAIKDPASEFAVVNYLQRSAAAKAARSIRQATNGTAAARQTPAEPRNDRNRRRMGHNLGRNGRPLCAGGCGNHSSISFLPAR